MQPEDRYSMIEQRINHLETDMTALRTRVDKKHEEITSIQQDIHRERDEMVSLIKAVTEMTTIQKEINKDTEKNSQNIGTLNSQISALKSEVNAYKWLAGIALTVAGGLLATILLKGLGVG